MRTIPLGPTLVVLVGPSGGGKSTYAKQFSPNEIVSTDALRAEITGDFRRQDMDSLVYNEFSRRIRFRLEAGLRVVADSTHITDTDRRRTARLGAAYGAHIVYVIVDRSLPAKLNSAGWRENVHINGKQLVIAHDETFHANLNKILAGDSITKHVIDTRKEVADVIVPLSRDRHATWEVEQAPLIDINSRGYKGILVIGDTHGNLVGLRKMARYARENNLFIVSLGDIVDYGVDTLRASEYMTSLIFDGQAAQVFANHERKILKWIIRERTAGAFARDDDAYQLLNHLEGVKQNIDLIDADMKTSMLDHIELAADSIMPMIGGFEGRLSPGNDVTINQLKALPPNERLVWETRFIGACALMPHIIRMPGYTFVHGAANEKMILSDAFRFSEASPWESLAVFGETSGLKVNGFPERTYNWVDEVPARQTVVVGHECRQETYPFVHIGGAGGRAVFLDTGSGKPDRFPEGRLSAMVLDIQNKKKVGFILDNERFISEHDLS